jgi:sporulation protein YlmC with PRC-barrel domain
MKCNIVPATIAALALSLSPALAQETSQPREADPMIQETMPEGDAPEIVFEGVTPFLAQQESGHWLSSNLIGQEVTNPAGDTIGEVAALEIDGEGKVVGIVIEAGGFLGLGTKLVGVPYDAVEHSKVEPGDQKLVIKASLDEIDAAPAFLTSLQIRQAEEAAKARQEAEQLNAPAVGEPQTAQ